MELTVAEVALAVDKPEAFVRQHIHRRHLLAQKRGRSVTVSLEAALSWARERNLDFSMPQDRRSVLSPATERAARMAVLVLRESDTLAVNLLTTVRHRRREHLGPWAVAPSGTWRRTELGGPVSLFLRDAPYVDCDAALEEILEHGALHIDGLEVRFQFEPLPRRHWAYRDHMAGSESALASPFKDHSAEVREHWSLDTNLRDRWRTLVSDDTLSEGGLRDLGFPLLKRSDRVGNVIVAGAEDDLTCELSALRGRTLCFSVEAHGSPLLPDSCRATIWASHSGNEVFHQERDVQAGSMLIDLESEVDRIGFALYRTTDGQCIDMMDVPLVMEISLRMEMSAGPELVLQDRECREIHRLPPRSSTTMIDVRGDEHDDRLDRGIRRLHLERLVHERQAAARAARQFARFQPGEVLAAARYLAGFIAESTDERAPIYLADPYLFEDLRGDREEMLRAYLALFAALGARPVRVLCARRDPGTPAWWRSVLDVVRPKAAVRTFLRRSQDGRRMPPAFHDRYLITPEREVWMSHSLNGWQSQGVTIASMPYGVYRAEADQLWSLPVDPTSQGLLVKEVHP